MVCPCCGADVDVYQGGISCHLGCCFQCDLEDFDRISAAMELAKAEVSASKAIETVPLDRLEAALEASESMLFDAKMHVLEVFG